MTFATSQFSPLIAEMREAMREGQDALFLRCIVRLAEETGHSSAESMTAVVEEIAPLLEGLAGTFSRLALLAGALVDRGASPLALREATALCRRSDEALSRAAGSVGASSQRTTAA